MIGLPLVAVYSATAVAKQGWQAEARLANRLNETGRPEGLPTRPAIWNARTSAANKTAADAALFAVESRVAKPGHVIERDLQSLGWGGG